MDTLKHPIVKYVIYSYIVKHIFGEIIPCVSINKNNLNVQVN